MISVQSRVLVRMIDLKNWDSWNIMLLQASVGAFVGDAFPRTCNSARNFGKQAKDGLSSSLSGLANPVAGGICDGSRFS
jgi:hypothetical protein